jgi:hypothetical protein
MWLFQQPAAIVLLTHSPLSQAHLGDEPFGWSITVADAAAAPAAAEEAPIVPMGEELPLEPAQ